MSIFGSIVSAIFGHAQAQPASAGTSGNPSTVPGQTPAGGAPKSGTGNLSNVDVAAVLNGLAAKNPEKLDWKKSIVDLMKLLNLDSSLTARKELAKELGYTGDTNDSATMNVWLHKQVIQKLAENGGKMPADLIK